MTAISIHALREEGDCRGSAPCSGVRHFYPRPPRGGRPVPGLAGRHHRGISIHALREEGDPPEASRPADRVISIHALREEGDILLESLNSQCLQFLSTPSARRATGT